MWLLRSQTQVLTLVPQALTPTPQLILLNDCQNHEMLVYVRVLSSWYIGALDCLPGANVHRRPWASSSFGGSRRKTSSSLTASLLGHLSSNVVVWPWVVYSLDRTISTVHCLHISPGTHAVPISDNLADDLGSYRRKKFFFSIHWRGEQSGTYL